MSAKKSIFILFIPIFVGCTNANKEKEPLQKENACSYYLSTDIHIGYAIHTPITSLNMEIGQLSDVKLQKNEIIYTLLLHQNDVLFSDSELIFDQQELIINNKKSTGKLLPCGDTIRITLSHNMVEIPPKDTITLADIDSLQQRIQKLNQLIEELDGTH
jgi:hypothetical protein